MTVKKGGLMEDMISRNDAYNTLTEYYHHTTEIQHKALREALERVPDSQPELIGREAYIRGFEQGKTQGRLDTLSAQPEKRTEERTETHACDCISRKDAIDAHYEYCNKHPDAGFPVWSLKILEDLPSAQPDSKELSFTQKKLDTISRQAAIRIVDGIDTWQAGWRGDAIESMKALPSAQSEPIRINLNEPIKVKLTDWGKEIYYHQYDRTNQIAGREICKPMFPREDENGYTEFQLWCFIELYGMHMGMTLPNVIEPLEIVYER